MGKPERLTKSVSRAPRLPTWAVTVALFVTAAGWAWAQEQQVGPDLDGVRAALEKWVQTRKTIAEERKNLALRKEVLGERIDLVRQEIEAVKARIELANKSITDADKKREEMFQENEKLKANSASLIQTVGGLEARTLALLPRLPEPIRERVKPLSQRLPKAGEATKLSLSERYQNVVGILNEINKFSREITVASELRSLPDGSTAEVTALYLGIARAYYANASGTIAGSGAAGDSGWVWTPDNAAAPRIAQAIAILKNESPAAFVPLPVEVR